MRGQRGGIALLMACLLLALMASAALAATRNVLREWAMTGTQLGRARAFLAAEAGLAWAETRFGLPLGEAPSLADQGPFILEGDQGPALRTGFRVHRRCLGRVPRPGAGPVPGSPGLPESPLDELWECHAHGHCRLGPPGPSAVTCHEVCHGWFLVSPPGGTPFPVRRLAWSCNSPCFCDNNVTASW